MNKLIIKKLKPIIIVIVAISLIGLGLMWVGNQEKIIEGRVEGQVISHVSEVSGKIIDMPIELGQTIKKGESIAQIDTSEWEYALEQLKIAYDIARVQKTNTTGLASNLTKMANLEMVRIESQINNAERMINKCSIVAGSSGIVMSKNFSVGDVISAGFDLADICGTEASLIVAYIPMDEFKNLNYGDILPFKYKGDIYQAAIIFMDVKSTYTPEELKTTLNKNKENLRIKLSLPENCNILPGEMVEINLNDIK